MDALKTIIIWPVYTLKYYLTISIGVGITIIPLFFKVLTQGTSSITKYTDLFSFFSFFPLGREVFTSIIYLFAPYSTSIGCTVQTLSISNEVISSMVTMDELPWLKNPFNSIHAIALANLGELTSGLCLTSLFQHLKLKGIPVKIETIYIRKAKGRIFGRCEISLSKLSNNISSEFVVETIITDSKGIELAKCLVTWSLKGPSVTKKE